MRVTPFSAICLAGAVAAVLEPLPGLAQDRSGANIAAGGTAVPGAAATFAVAQELFAIGMANKDALSVLAAARLAGSVGLSEGETAEIDPARLDPAALAQAQSAGRAAAPVPVMRAPEAGVTVGKISLSSAARESAGSASDGSAAGPVDAATMLAAARELAGEDEILLGLIEDAEAEGTRGRIGGATRRASRLPAGMTDVWEVPFYGSSYTEIAVIGDGGSNLDVLVSDEGGNTVCYEVGRTDKVACDFVPAWNGYFYITVQNTGQQSNSYYLMTN